MVSAGKIAEERRSRRGGSFALTPFPNPSQPRPQGEVDPLLCLPAHFSSSRPHYLYSTPATGQNRKVQLLMTRRSLILMLLKTLLKR